MKRVNLIALILALALPLSGCRAPNITIEPIPLDPAQIAAYDASPEANYQSPGYYAPNAVMPDAPIVPAPASADEIRAAAAAAAAAQRPEVEPASIYAPDMPRGDINIGVVMGDGIDINPLRCTYQDMMNINTQVYEGLIALDQNQMPVPQLADRWTPSGANWDFTIRGGVRFHDGQLLTPDDVVASYEELKRNPGSYWYPALSIINGMSVVNENTVRVHSATKGFMTLYALTFPIIPRSAIMQDTPPGTGPYLVSQYSPGNAVRIEINTIWWKRAEGSVKSIVALFYPDSKSAIAAMETGEIDTLATEYPTAAIGRNLSDRQSLDYATLTYECIVPNLRNPILREDAVREALMYAIDRATLAQNLYAGMVQESEVPVVPGTWLYERQAARYSYNPERALKILYDAGWKPYNGILAREIDGKLTNLKLRLYTADRGTTSTRSEACLAIQNQLRLVGINIELSRMSHSNLLTNLKESKFDLALCAFELGEVPNLFFLLNSAGDSNYARYNSGEMDQYLRAAYDAPTADELVAAMSRVQMKIVNDLPILGLCFRNGVLSSRTSLSGVVNPRRGYVLEGIALGGAP